MEISFENCNFSSEPGSGARARAGKTGKSERKKITRVVLGVQVFRRLVNLKKQNCLTCYSCGVRCSSVPKSPKTGKFEKTKFYSCGVRCSSVLKTGKFGKSIFFFTRLVLKCWSVLTTVKFGKSNYFIYSDGVTPFELGVDR